MLSLIVAQQEMRIYYLMYLSVSSSYQHSVLYVWLNNLICTTWVNINAPEIVVITMYS